MQRRLEKIGGRCEIQSAPGQGTEVQFVVPVPSDQPDLGQTRAPTPEPGASQLPAGVAKSRDKPFDSDLIK
jgi:hypothetical protein